MLERRSCMPRTHWDDLSYAVRRGWIAGNIAEQ